MKKEPALIQFCHYKPKGYEAVTMSDTSWLFNMFRLFHLKAYPEANKHIFNKLNQAITP